MLEFAITPKKIAGLIGLHPFKCQDAEFESLCSDLDINIPSKDENDDIKVCDNVHSRNNEINNMIRKNRNRHGSTKRKRGCLRTNNNHNVVLAKTNDYTLLLDMDDCSNTTLSKKRNKKIFDVIPSYERVHLEMLMLANESNVSEWSQLCKGKTATRFYYQDKAFLDMILERLGQICERLQRNDLS